MVSRAGKGCSQRSTQKQSEATIGPCCGCIPPAPSILYRRKNRLSSFSILEHRPLVSFSSPVTLTPKKLHRWIDAPNVNAKAGCSLCRRGQRPESGHKFNPLAVSPSYIRCVWVRVPADAVGCASVSSISRLSLPRSLALYP